MKKEVPIALVNDDYEFKLFKDEIGQSDKIKKTQHALDFMFLFMNRNPDHGLYIPKLYNDIYLQNLTDLGVRIPEFSTEKYTYNWYGKLTDIEKEKRLNSKIYSYELLNELKFNSAPNFIVKSGEEIKKIVSAHSYERWLLKSPYMMGGIGFQQITDLGSVPEIHGEHILEPFLKRIVEVSYFYQLDEKKFYYYMNRSSAEGKHIGGIIFADESDFESHLKSLGVGECYRKWRDMAGPIQEKVLAQNIEQPFSVDGFFYEDEAGKHVHPMTEINYRQTLGGLIVSLRRYLGKNGVGRLVAFKKLPGMTTNDFMPYSELSKKGVIYLSPPDSGMFSIFCCGSNYEEMDHVHNIFWRYYAGASSLV